MDLAGAAEKTALDSLRSAGVAFDVFSDIRCEPTGAPFRDAIAAFRAAPSTASSQWAADRRSTRQRPRTCMPRGPLIRGVRQSHARARRHAARAAQAADRRADDGRHRERDDGGRRLRLRTRTSQDRHREPRHAFDARRLESREHAQLPQGVAASAGLDVLSHALESFTARDYLQRESPHRPWQRADRPGHEPDQNGTGIAPKGARTFGGDAALYERDLLEASSR
jgi:hypothetical protein